jgi:hypothetical protein
MKVFELNIKGFGDLILEVFTEGQIDLSARPCANNKRRVRVGHTVVPPLRWQWV